MIRNKQWVFSTQKHDFIEPSLFYNHCKMQKIRSPFYRRLDRGKSDTKVKSIAKKIILLPGSPVKFG